MVDQIGTFRAYGRPIDFKPDTLSLIDQANAILSVYEAAGNIMTLRQLYYQLVAKNAIPNRKEEYNRLGGIISDARMAGLTSWTALEDRARNLMGLTTYDSPGQAIDKAKANYRLDLWANQPTRVEVWVEKEALAGVIGTICNKLRVDFFACKGYNSQSEAWRAGQRFAGYIRKGQRPVVLHLGDHDPSGLDMTRDNRDRLSTFAGTPISVVRIALNMPQIIHLQPPPNPAKPTDSRYGDYAQKYGPECYELDALTPGMIHEVIGEAVLRLRDQKLWDEATAEEADDLRRFEAIVEDMGEGNDEA